MYSCWCDVAWSYSIWNRTVLIDNTYLIWSNFSTAVYVMLIVSTYSPSVCSLYRIALYYLSINVCLVSISYIQVELASFFSIQTQHLIRQLLSTSYRSCYCSLLWVSIRYSHRFYRLGTPHLQSSQVQVTTHAWFLYSFRWCQCSTQPHSSCLRYINVGISTTQSLNRSYSSLLLHCCHYDESAYYFSKTA
jgi:hypothetical protein